MAQDNSVGETWKGSSISEITNNKEVWNFDVIPLNISNSHTVFCNLQLTFREPPAPLRISGPDIWDSNHVRMPYSNRWDVIKKSLSRPINNSRALENAIKSYTLETPPFSALHGYFDDLEYEQNEIFFRNLLPKIISLCLALPEILPDTIPLIKRNQNRSVTLSQEQIASLLANAFLCTFPWKKNSMPTFGTVNFVGLYISDQKKKQVKCVREKLNAIFNYFDMVTKSMPLGIVTFERKSIPKPEMPRWDYLHTRFNQTKIHIDSAGTIEDNGNGFLQVVFGNVNIGGTVLRYGCTDEEIRFITYPELIISRMFVEQLSDLETLIVTGVQRYSTYSGFADSFSWERQFHDLTPYDEYGRRKTTLCIIDPTRYSKFSKQFNPSAMQREADKAYVGFSSRDRVNLAPVATGNWGCGIFKGTPYLKAILQLLACVVSKRHMVYYTSGNTQFRDDFYDMYSFLTTNEIKIQDLWMILCQFSSSSCIETDLYPFIKKTYFDNRNPSRSEPFFKRYDNAAGPSNVMTIPSVGYENIKRHTSGNDRYCDKQSKRGKRM